MAGRGRAITEKEKDVEFLLPRCRGISIGDAAPPWMQKMVVLDSSGEDKVALPPPPTIEKPPLARRTRVETRERR